MGKYLLADLIDTSLFFASLLGVLSVFLVLDLDFLISVFLVIIILPAYLLRKKMGKQKDGLLKQSYRHRKPLLIKIGVFTLLYNLPFVYPIWSILRQYPSLSEDFFSSGPLFFIAFFLFSFFHTFLVISLSFSNRPDAFKCTRIEYREREMAIDVLSEQTYNAIQWASIAKASFISFPFLYFLIAVVINLIEGLPISSLQIFAVIFVFAINALVIRYFSSLIAMSVEVHPLFEPETQSVAEKSSKLPVTTDTVASALTDGISDLPEKPTIASVSGHKPQGSYGFRIYAIIVFGIIAFGATLALIYRTSTPEELRVSYREFTSLIQSKPLSEKVIPVDIIYRTRDGLLRSFCHRTGQSVTVFDTEGSRIHDYAHETATLLCSEKLDNDSLLFSIIKIDSDPPDTLAVFRTAPNTRLGRMMTNNAIKTICSDDPEHYFRIHREGHEPVLHNGVLDDVNHIRQTALIISYAGRVLYRFDDDTLEAVYEVEAPSQIKHAVVDKHGDIVLLEMEQVERRMTSRTLSKDMDEIASKDLVAYYDAYFKRDDSGGHFLILHKTIEKILPIAVKRSFYQIDIIDDDNNLTEFGRYSRFLSIINYSDKIYTLFYTDDKGLIFICKDNMYKLFRIPDLFVPPNVLAVVAD